MCLGGMAIIRQEFAVDVVEVPFLLVGGTVAVLVDVLDLLALGVAVIREELGDRDTRRVRLGGGGLLLLLGLPLLLFLSRAGGAAPAAALSSASSSDSSLSWFRLPLVAVDVLGLGLPFAAAPSLL